MRVCRLLHRDSLVCRCAAADSQQGSSCQAGPSQCSAPGDRRRPTWALPLGLGVLRWRRGGRFCGGRTPTRSLAPSGLRRRRARKGTARPGTGQSALQHDSAACIQDGNVNALAAIRCACTLLRLARRPLGSSSCSFDITTAVYFSRAPFKVIKRSTVGSGAQS